MSNIQESNNKESNMKVSNNKESNPKNEVFETICKKQKPNQRRTLIAGNLPKRGWVDGPRDGPSWSRRTVVDSVVLYLVISSAALFFPSTASVTDRHRYDGPSHVSVEGHLEKMEIDP